MSYSRDDKCGNMQMWKSENYHFPIHHTHIRLNKELVTFLSRYSRNPIFTFSYFHIFTLEFVGKDGFEPPNSEEDRFTVCCRWPLGYLPNLSHLPESNWRPTDYKSVALPAELRWRLSHPLSSISIKIWS